MSKVTSPYRQHREGFDAGMGANSATSRFTSDLPSSSSRSILRYALRVPTAVARLSNSAVRRCISAHTAFDGGNSTPGRPLPPHIAARCSPLASETHGTSSGFRSGSLLLELGTPAVRLLCWLIDGGDVAALARLFGCSDSECRSRSRGSEGERTFRMGHPKRMVTTAVLLCRITLQPESSALGAPAW